MGQRFNWSETSLICICSNNKSGMQCGQITSLCHKCTDYASGARTYNLKGKCVNSCESKFWRNTNWKLFSSPGKKGSKVCTSIKVKSAIMRWWEGICLEGSPARFSYFSLSFLFKNSFTSPILLWSTIICYSKALQSPSHSLCSLSLLILAIYQFLGEADILSVAISRSVIPCKSLRLSFRSQVCYLASSQSVQPESIYREAPNKSYHSPGVSQWSERSVFVPSTMSTFSQIYNLI